MTDCTFCGSTLEQGTGKMYVRRDGTTWFFCTNKCQRNQVGLKRINRQVRWTKAFVQHRGGT